MEIILAQVPVYGGFIVLHEKQIDVIILPY